MQYGNIPVEKQDATVVAHIMMHNGPEKEEKNWIFDHTVLLHWGLFKFKLSRVSPLCLQLMEMIFFFRVSSLTKRVFLLHCPWKQGLKLWKQPKVSRTKQQVCKHCSHNVRNATIKVNNSSQSSSLVFKQNADSPKLNLSKVTQKKRYWISDYWYLCQEQKNSKPPKTCVILFSIVCNTYIPTSQMIFCVTGDSRSFFKTSKLWSKVSDS